MRLKDKTKIILMLVCISIGAFSYFAWKFPFYEYDENVYEITKEQLFSSAYIMALIPFMLIVVLTAIGIFTCIEIRKKILREDPLQKKYAAAHTNRAKGTVRGQKKIGFMTIRWAIMILSFFLMVFGGTLFGIQISEITFPSLACPVNGQQLVGSSCYYMAHIDELMELPLKEIGVFLLSTMGFLLVFGRMICGFFCPMGLIQDIMHQVRQKTKVEGISMTERMYNGLVPIKWVLVFIVIGLSFFGGNYCNFCPAITVSPILAGMKVSVYISGFIMVFVLIGSFFKRRIWCNVCPIGYIMGLTHKISLVRLKKNTQACTECGACYEACPMGIKMIYTERKKTGVTDMNCILCGECVKKCPENDALSMTFAGHKFYTASRNQVMSGYKITEREYLKKK